MYAPCMTEIITQTRAEDAVARATDFLSAERGTMIDGASAAGHVVDRVEQTWEQAERLLTDHPHPSMTGLYTVLSKQNNASFDVVAATLPGHIVLVPSNLVEPGPSSFHPAVVSEDGLKSRNMRLHVLLQKYRGSIGYGAALTLSAAGQSETPDIGLHDKGGGNDVVEAEHFATILLIGNDSNLQTAWQAGNHINHLWRQRENSSVTTEMSNRLFGKDIPQTTLTITKQQIENGRAALFWREGLRAEATQLPETATKQNALVILQALGYEALQVRGTQAVNNVRKLLA